MNFIDHQGEATLLFNDQPAWHLKSQDFLTQGDGHNCGPIACLKFMECENQEEGYGFKVDPTRDGDAAIQDHD